MIISLAILIASITLLLISARIYSRSDLGRTWRRWTLILGVPASILTAVVVAGNQGGVVGLAGGMFALGAILFASSERSRGKAIWTRRVNERLRKNPAMKEAFERHPILRRAMQGIDDSAAGEVKEPPKREASD